MLARLRPEWLSFRRFAAFTTTLTLTLMMLGVYTAATGSGLACSAQWPLCDNGLLPQTLPSFIEWFHRLVAMVTGFFILGTAAWTWRSGDRRTQTTSTLALVLLPLQVSIGAVTVTLSGMFPNGYTPSTQGAHLFTALSIFVALTLTTLFAYRKRFDGPASDRARRALAAAAGLLVLSALFSRVTTLFTYSPAAQAAFTGATLAAVGAFVAATFWLTGTGRPGPRLAAAGGAVSTVVVLALGRDLVLYTDAVLLVNTTCYVLGVVVAGAVAWTLRGEADSALSAGLSTGD